MTGDHRDHIVELAALVLMSVLAGIGIALLMSWGQGDWLKVVLPRPKVQSFCLHTSTGSAPRDAKFLLLRPSYFGGSSTGSQTVDSTADKHFRDLQLLDDHRAVVISSGWLRTSSRR